jgi:hypothetical protein
MSHQSKGDPNAHYSVQGETAAGSKVKGGHVTEDASKQTVSFCPCYVFKKLTSTSSKPVERLLCTQMCLKEDRNDGLG